MIQKRREEKIADLQKQIKGQNKIESKLEKAVISKERYRSQAHYHHKKREESQQRMSELMDEVQLCGEENFETLQRVEEKVKRLEEEVKQLRTDKQALMEKIEEIERQQVPTFQGRQYLNNVRQCCLELLSLNVGVKNIEPVIRSVLHHI